MAAIYKRDEYKLPQQITRQQYVKYVYEIGSLYSVDCNIMMTAVQLGDKFMSFIGPRPPYTWKKLTDWDEKSNPNYKILSAPIEQIYSKELAIVTIMIMSKIYEDSVFRTSMITFMNDAQNRYILKMEWEIVLLFNFDLKFDNFITISNSKTANHKELGPIFLDLVMEICMNKSLLDMNPFALILGIKLLYKHNKLAAIRRTKERLFNAIMKRVAYECDVPYDKLITAYIKSKT